MSIYKKLLEFQKLDISVKKVGKNPHFKSSYATLNEVLDKVKSPLNDLGVLIIFEPQADGLMTILLDVESDTKVFSFMKYVGINNAQSLLSCNTYFRRGSLVAILGLEDEDDDGTLASKPAVVKEEPVNVAQWKAELDKAKNLAELGETWKNLPPRVKENIEIINHAKAIKSKIK